MGGVISYQTVESKIKKNEQVAFAKVKAIKDIIEKEGYSFKDYKW